MRTADSTGGSRVLPKGSGVPSRSASGKSTRDEAAIRSAMLSIYYESRGRELEISGAPSILLPLQVQPQPLAHALEQLEDSPTRLQEGLWLLVRGTRVKTRDKASPDDYPVELRPYVEPGSLADLVRLRRRYRAGANLFAAALLACRDGYRRQFLALSAALKGSRGNSAIGFSAVTDLLLGMAADEYLESMAEPANWRREQRQLRSLENEVGVNIYDFIEQLADAAAFTVFAGEHVRPRPEGRSPALRVYPVSSVVRQDRKTLTTSATATTLVKGQPSAIGMIADPQLWDRSSDVIQKATFVQDPFSLEPMKLAPARIGKGFEGVRLLEEHAAFAWGRRSDEESVFHNVLTVEHRVKGMGLAQQCIDIKFSLCRSIDSSILWDRRAGGLQLDEGYLKVRPLGRDTWRVTWHKMLRFSDRSPYVGGQGMADFGQMLNYLAPAALTWWVESETYSMADPGYSDEPLNGEGNGWECGHGDEQ